MPTPATILATSLTISLVGTLILYIRDLKRRHDPTNDDADVDRAVDYCGFMDAGMAFHDKDSAQ